MKTKWHRLASITIIVFFGSFVFISFYVRSAIGTKVSAQVNPTPTPAAAAAFDQAAAIAKLKEQIKGHEQEPGEKVYKNLQMPMMRSMPAARLLAVMEFGYARSLGVNCTHCHTPDKWESEDNPKKQIAREMAAMAAKINGELLKNIKNLSQNPTVNCTTCHRGQVIPATSLPQPPKS